MEIFGRFARTFGTSIYWLDTGDTILYSWDRSIAIMDCALRTGNLVDSHFAD